jgi:hypothetical protein
MSSASNLGYGNITPLSNVNGSYVNVDSSNFAGRFSSNEVPGLPGLAGSKFKGGSKKLKSKIKNITKQYKRMKAGSRKIKSMKRRLRHRAISRKLARSYTGGRNRHTRHRRHRRHMRGGYAQYQNNMPMTPSYQVAGIHLPSSQIALANPPPITKLSNDTSCIDNYNHYTNMGFPSKGH